MISLLGVVLGLFGTGVLLQGGGWTRFSYRFGTREEFVLWLVAGSVSALAIWLALGFTAVVGLVLGGFFSLLLADEELSERRFLFGAVVAPLFPLLLLELWVTGGDLFTLLAFPLGLLACGARAGSVGLVWFVAIFAWWMLGSAGTESYDWGRMALVLASLGAIFAERLREELDCEDNGPIGQALALGTLAGGAFLLAPVSSLSFGNVLWFSIGALLGWWTGTRVASDARLIAVVGLFVALAFGPFAGGWLVMGIACSGIIAANSRLSDAPKDWRRGVYGALGAVTLVSFVPGTVGGVLSGLLFIGGAFGGWKMLPAWPQAASGKVLVFLGGAVATLVPPLFVGALSGALVRWLRDREGDLLPFYVPPLAFMLVTLL